MATATMKKPKADKREVLPAGIPETHRLALKASSQGELSPQNRESLDDFWQAVQEYLRDEHELHLDRQALLERGIDLSLREVVNTGQELSARKAAFEHRQELLQAEKFRLVLELLPDFRRIARVADGDYIAAIEAKKVEFERLGISRQVFGSGSAGEVAYNHRVSQEIDCLISKQRRDTAKSDLAGIESLAEVAARPRHSPIKIQWHSPTGPDESIVSRVADIS